MLCAYSKASEDLVGKVSKVTKSFVYTIYNYITNDATPEAKILIQFYFCPVWGYKITSVHVSCYSRLQDRHFKVIGNRGEIT